VSARPPVAALTILVVTVAFATAGGGPAPQPVRVAGQRMMALRLPFAEVDYPAGIPEAIAREAVDDLASAGRTPRRRLRIVLFAQGAPGDLSLAPTDSDALARAIDTIIGAAPRPAPVMPQAVLDEWSWWVQDGRLHQGARLRATGLAPGTQPAVLVDGQPLQGPLPRVGADGTLFVALPRWVQSATVDGIPAQPAAGPTPSPPPGV